MTSLVPHTRRSTDLRPDSSSSSDAAGRARRLRRGLLVAVPVGYGLVVALLLAAGGSSYWRYIAAEDTPMTWLQSVVLVLCGATASLLATLGYLSGRSSWRVWLLLAVGFTGLGLDDRFAVHERLRDRVLSKIEIGLPWGAPGDYVLLVVAAVGLVLLPRVLRTVSTHPLSRGLFLAAVLLALVVIGVDSFNPPDSQSVDAERFEQTAEEIVELGSHLLFLLALLVRLVDDLARTTDR